MNHIILYIYYFILYYITSYTTTRFPMHGISNERLISLISLLRLKSEKNDSKNYNYKSPESSSRDEPDRYERPWRKIAVGSRKIEYL